MNKYSDGEWVRLLKLEPPDAAALEHLWLRVITFCDFQARFKRQDEAFGLDAAHLAIGKVMKNLHSYRLEGSFEGWWRRIAVRSILDLLDKANTESRRQLSLDDDFELVHVPAIQELPAESDLVRRRIQPCLEELPKRQRQVIELRYLWRNSAGEAEELAPEAVAKVLGITREAVNVAAAHARAALGRCLRQFGFLAMDDLLFL